MSKAVEIWLREKEAGFGSMLARNVSRPAVAKSMIGGGVAGALIGGGASGEGNRGSGALAGGVAGALGGGVLARTALKRSATARRIGQSAARKTAPIMTPMAGS